MQEILECEIKNYLIFGESQTSRFGQKIKLELRQNFFLFVLKATLSKAAADCTYKEQGAVMRLFWAESWTACLCLWLFSCKLIHSKEQHSAQWHSAYWDCFKKNIVYADCHIYWVPFMLIVTYAECHLCWMSFMLSVAYAECCLCWVSFMLSVTYKTFLLIVVMLSVGALSKGRPLALLFKY